MAVYDIQGRTQGIPVPVIGVVGGAPFPVTEVKPTVGTVSSVVASAVSVTLLALNTSRKGATFYNDSNATLFIKLGATASTTSFTQKLFPQAFWQLPFPIYTGVIDGIWDSAIGNLRVTELT